MTLQKTDSQVSGAKLLAACGYDHRLCGAVIASQDNWQELLETIGPGQLQRNVAMIVWLVRQACGKDFDYAREITQGPA
jgi:hypothetical protein